MIKKIVAIIGFMVLLFSCQLAQAQLSLKVEGLEGKLEDNVDAYLSNIPQSEYSTSLRFLSRIEKLIKESLQALGYYHSEIVVTVDEKQQLLQFTVTAGEPIVIKAVDIMIIGEAESDSAFTELLAKSKIKVGSILNQGQYDELKSSISNLALHRGYFNGHYTQSRLEVAPDLKQAFISLHYNSGIRSHFGKTQLHGSHIEESRILSLLPYKEGDPYLVSKVGEFNQNLSNTDWFSSVSVESDFSQLDQQRELPMVVSLAPQVRNQFETGIGYSTNVGARTSLKWKKPWITQYGHSFDSSLSLSMPEQQVTASYKIPLDDVLRDYYRIRYGLKHVDNNDTQSLESNLVFERHWLLDSNWHRTVYLRYLLENYDQGFQSDVGHMLLPGVTYSRTRMRGGSMTMWADKQSFTIEYGDDAVISETRVLRLLAESSWIRGFASNHRAVLRLKGDANVTDDLEALPPSLRFFAGGDNNLRGYSYESISPLDRSGALMGAKYMATSTLEYQYRVAGQWWGALFFDYGDAFNDTPDWKRGVGTGIRWGSPVGTIRLDFAWGLDSEPGDEFRIHFSLGSEL